MKNQLEKDGIEYMFKSDKEIEEMLRERLSFETMIAEISRKLKSEERNAGRDTQVSNQDLMDINIT